MKTALFAVALGAAIALAWSSEPARAAGSATDNNRSGGHSFDLLSDDACDGDNKCETGDQSKAVAEGKGADGDSAEDKNSDARTAEAEPTATPEPETSTLLATAKQGSDKPKEEADKESAEGKDDAGEEAEEEDDEWDDGPYEDEPFDFDGS